MDMATDWSREDIQYGGNLKNCIDIFQTDGSMYQIKLNIVIFSYFDQGPSIVESDEQKKGLIQRVVDGLFECSKSSEETTKCTIKLSMVLRQ